MKHRKITFKRSIFSFRIPNALNACLHHRIIDKINRKYRTTVSQQTHYNITIALGI